MKQWFQQHRSFFGICVAITAVYGVLFALGITCPIKYITGVSCPGCGMSRAMWALIRLDFSTAVYYHPLCFAIPPVGIGLAYFHAMRRRRAFSALLLGMSVAMVAVYLYRLFFVDQSIVTADLKSGWLVRCWLSIIH